MNRGPIIALIQTFCAIFAAYFLAPTWPMFFGILFALFAIKPQWGKL